MASCIETKFPSLKKNKKLEVASIFSNIISFLISLVKHYQADEQANQFIHVI